MSLAALSASEIAFDLLTIGLLYMAVEATLQRRRLQRDARHSALGGRFDPVTGLPGRGSAVAGVALQAKHASRIEGMRVRVDVVCAPPGDGDVTGIDLADAVSLPALAYRLDATTFLVARPAAAAATDDDANDAIAGIAAAHGCHAAAAWFPQDAGDAPALVRIALERLAGSGDA